MAGSDIVGSIKQQSNKVKDGVSGVVSKTGIIDMDKQKAKPLFAKKVKMFEFIGMEVYDLYLAGKVSIHEIEPFCQQIDLLNAELAKLEKQEAKAPGGIICGCGTSLSADAKFCHSCGTKVEELSSRICVCGSSLSEESKFCQSCGRSVADIGTPQEAEKVECVCGAVVDADSAMCMECGRRVAAA